MWCARCILKCCNRYVPIERALLASKWYFTCEKAEHSCICLAHAADQIERRETELYLLLGTQLEIRFAYASAGNNSVLHVAGDLHFMHPESARLPKALHELSRFWLLLWTLQNNTTTQTTQTTTWIQNRTQAGNAKFSHWFFSDRVNDDDATTSGGTCEKLYDSLNFKIAQRICLPECAQHDFASLKYDSLDCVAPIDFRTFSTQSKSTSASSNLNKCSIWYRVACSNLV